MSKEIFVCPEESSFYAHCLSKLLLEYCQTETCIHEFGSGDGLPMIEAVHRSSFQGVIHGYEIQNVSWNLACNQIKQHQIEQHYIVHHDSFFNDCNKPYAETLVTNPPYLPAWTDDVLYMKGLYGGVDGSMVSRKLLSLQYSTVMLMISSFSNPASLLQYAGGLGYSVVDFLIQPMPFGFYSSQPEVKSRIVELYHEYKAFFSEHYYLLACVIFQKKKQADVELSADLMTLMQSLR
jgi:methylase of polypeptide subunit release factors